VFDCPDNTIHEQLELLLVTLDVIHTQKRLTRKAVEVDHTKKFEEPHAVLWELCKVLIDHIQCSNTAPKIAGT